jgi:hypothetical protein
VELREDVFDAALYGLLGDVQGLADVAVLLARGNHLEDHQLPIAQGVHSSALDRGPQAISHQGVVVCDQYAESGFSVRHD